jgi:tRNA pseudouridine55 synthase
MARRRKKHPAFRELDGILLLDKPRGMSSNAVLQVVRRLYAAEKGGHTGALDPLATGLLPLCFGEATKIAGLLLSERKAYEVLARFGIETDTCDADGVVVAERPLPALSVSGVVEALAPFVGRIRQIPPIYSALKLEGEPLYLKARRGEAVEISAREVDVQQISLLELGIDSARLRIECGSGTYIRSIVRDLGTALGCGAHVAELRRLWVEPFRAPRMHQLAELEQVAAQGREALDALLLPIEAGLDGLREFRLDPDQARRLGQGQILPWQDDTRGEGVAYDRQGRALGLVALGEAGLRPKRLFKHGFEAGRVGAGAAEVGPGA